MDDITTIYVKICERWGMPVVAPTDDDKWRVLGISLGLGELFSEDIEAERDWLESTHTHLGVSPREHMSAAGSLGIRDILDLVSEARGLK